VKDLGEPRGVSRCLRLINRAFGSLPFSNCRSYIRIGAKTSDCTATSTRF
jgi:hypothetical protein